MFVPWAEFRYAAGMTKEQPGTGARRRPRSGGCPNETRQKLITAATGVFAEHGFRGASVREIADAVGMTFPLVTYHFGSKENLWLAVAEKALAEIVELSQGFSIPDDCDPTERMQAYFRLVLLDSTRHPDRRRILAQISARNDKDATKPLAPLLADFQSSSTLRIQRLIDLGFPTRLSAQDIQMVLRGLLASNASAPLGPANLFSFRSNKALVDYQVQLMMRLCLDAEAKPES